MDKKAPKAKDVLKSNKKAEKKQLPKEDAFKSAVKAKSDEGKKSKHDKKEKEYEQ